MLLINERINLALIAIETAKDSRDNETKSSVGDKYETGRTLMQQEVEKNRIQLQKYQNIKSELEKINLLKKYDRAEFGSLVWDEQNIYFISIALGKVEVENESCFCISLASPIGKALHNKRIGDIVSFRGNTIKILSIE